MIPNRELHFILCLEDSYTRIQSRLFDIADDAPPTVHFATVSENIGNGIGEQIEDFICEYPNTKLIVIDILQKIRSASNDNAYASDYRDIGMLKSIADKFSIAILLIHHLRKQKDDDPMNMVSGTTGITGAVDSSFVLVKDKRSSEKAILYCDGRDIEYRELQLQFNKEIHLWEMVSDSVENPNILFDKTIEYVLEFMKENNYFYGTPTELTGALQIYADEKITLNSLSKKLLQNQLELKKTGIDFTLKRSNGKRYVELKMSVDSDGSGGKNDIPPYLNSAITADPAVTAMTR